MHILVPVFRLRSCMQRVDDWALLRERRSGQISQHPRHD